MANERFQMKDEAWPRRGERQEKPPLGVRDHEVEALGPKTMIVCLNQLNLARDRNSAVARGCSTQPRSAIRATT